MLRRLLVDHFVHDRMINETTRTCSEELREKVPKDFLFDVVIAQTKIFIDLETNVDFRGPPSSYYVNTTAFETCLDTS